MLFSTTALNWSSWNPAADVLVLKGLCDDNVDFTAGLQAYVAAQGGLILNVESIPVGVQIVIYALEELQIV